MSTSVNTIKWLLGVLLGVIILTYLISLNMENHFVIVNHCCPLKIVYG